MEEITNLPDSIEALSNVMPGVLEEEILIVELKNVNDNNDIRSVMLLTLREDLCNLNSKPIEGEGKHKIWCWNVTRNDWFLLDFSEVESAENWPPINDK